MALLAYGPAINRNGASGGDLARSGALADIASALAAAVLSVAILHIFHDRSWWAPDDASYGYVARILASGGVYARDIHDVHAGYVHFLHAAAFRLFGDDLLSLRYPLVLAIFAASMLLFALLLPKGRLQALTGAVSASALTAPVFMNPSANWYALLLAVVMAAVLTWMPLGSTARLFMAGFIAGLALLTRQLSGVFIVMGAATIVLMEHGPAGQNRGAVARAVLARAVLARVFLARVFLARVFLAAMAAVLALYMLNKQSLTGFLLFGAAPLAGLAIAIARTRCTDAAALRIAGLMSAGALAAATPLLVYHAAHGTLTAWAEDAVVVALNLNAMDFIRDRNIAVFILQAIAGNLASLTLFSLAAALFWLALAALPVVFAVRYVLVLTRGGAAGDFAPLPTIALFYLPVAAHYQTHVYLCHMLALPLAGLLWLSDGASRSPRRNMAFAALVAFVAGMGLLVLAGQPLTRGGLALVRGEPATLDNDRPLPHASLRIERWEADNYRRILALIEQNSRPDEPILAAPFIPEFYYLSGRRGWLGGIGTPFDMRDGQSLDAALERLDRSPPALVIHKRNDKYNGLRTLALIEAVKARFRPAHSIGGYDIYLPADPVTDRKPLRAMLRGTL